MYLKSLELIGFKSFGKKCTLEFSTPITSIVGPNGSGKSNTAEAFRFVLGEQSIKSLRGKRGEDLIWGGSSEVPRSNRASVKAVFDNTKRLLDIDFDEVVIERVVYREGTNEYLINGSKVRLKDVSNLLAGANIGASGHHIISQGEADRVIVATSRERRQIIEDALGLRVYQYKKEESLRKLEKTEENRGQVEALRHENIPHLRFLERQVKKLEKARVLREELVYAYHEYLKHEEDHLQFERESVAGLREEPSREIREVGKRIENIRSELEKTKKGNKESEALLTIEKRLSELRTEQTTFARSVGRIEGQISFEERRLEDEKKKASEEEGRPISYSTVRSFWDELTLILKERDDEEDVDMLKKVLKEARRTVAAFVGHHLVKTEYIPDTSILLRLQKEKEFAETKSVDISKDILEQEQRMRLLSEEIEKEKDESREIERELFTLIAAQTELRSTLAKLDARESTLRRDEDEFKREIGEGVVLIGRQIQGYKDFVPKDDHTDLGLDDEKERTLQTERRRNLEKMKIRLEEIGGASADEITKEYTEVKERDEFLEKELVDLEQSAELLRKLINELEKELGEKFTQGLTEISTQFNSFFALMFGGGSASLTLSEIKRKSKSDVDTMLTDGEIPEEDDTQAGVDISVSLPKKRIQSLMMLSGGERALTSIALIFAMSQVNPPPFLILDETDAALDEANSRRYGDMIQNLSEKSQLIVITHNRETMSRADILYGITMGIDGVSRILSVKFDDAVTVAK
ncbi:MAG: Chromosome partition protein smc [Parcubacteria group bacterium GW2011_GWC2_42_11]|nr:MAG: Chromosome partition protein smc [Parcubacteria group bacterium GW2011_GWC2_42_11]